MRCTFVAMGWENISLQALSAVLKANGHECTLAYDQALFDDKNYLCIPPLAKLFNMRERVVDEVVESKPDLVAFSVLATTYRWALEMAEKIKERIDVPIVFGGIHPSSIPERCIQEDGVDIVCVGEGEEALLELCNSIERGEIDHAIKNLWFKTPGGEVIRNPRRPQIQDLDALPFPDKELFAPHVPIQNCYLSVVARGCPFACSYCSLSFEAQEWKKMGGRRFRLRSVDSVIRELKLNKERYGYRWVDFRHSVMADSTEWILEFCRRYKEEIRRPFRIFWHPLLVTDEAAAALKEAGCSVVQVGLESYDEGIRNEILNRRMTNAQVEKAVGILERHGLRYSLDYILGLPSQTEEELMRFAELFAGLKNCYRVSSFMLQYLPKTEIIRHGLESACLTEEDVRRLEEGYHDTYMVDGSVSLDKEMLRTMNSYRVLYRLMSLLPTSGRKLLVKAKAQRLFRYLPPRPIVLLLDILMALRDLDGRTYIRNYLWWIGRRFDRSNPACIFGRRKTERAVRVGDRRGEGVEQPLKNL